MTDADHPRFRRAPLLPKDMGEIRTILAADRTLMAWVRTALSMLSFGFTIYKFLESAVQKDVVANPESPRQVGLFLCAMGTLSMVLGTYNYWATLRDLNRMEEFRLGRPSLVIALIISIAGVLMFLSIATRVV